MLQRLFSFIVSTTLHFILRTITCVAILTSCKHACHTKRQAFRLLENNTTLHASCPQEDIMSIFITSRHSGGAPDFFFSDIRPLTRPRNRLSVARTKFVKQTTKPTDLDSMVLWLQLPVAGWQSEVYDKDWNPGRRRKCVEKPAMKPPSLWHKSSTNQ